MSNVTLTKGSTVIAIMESKNPKLNRKPTKMIIQTVLAAEEHQQERRSRPGRKEKYMPVSITSVPKKVVSNQEIYQVQIVSDQPSCFLRWGDTEDKGRALDDVHFAFSTISHSFLITKLVRYGLDE